jgi:hypothetical protein
MSHITGICCTQVRDALALPLPDIPLRGQTAESLLIGQAVDRRGGECVFHERSALMHGLEVDCCYAEIMN